MDILLAEQYESKIGAPFTDSLTGLYNNGFFQISLANEIKRSERYGNVFSIALVDVDSFTHFNMFYVYLIQSKEYGTFYIGHSNNTQARLKDHNRGKCKYTKNKGPWELLAYKEFATRALAMAEEKRLKKLKNRQAIVDNFRIL